MKFFLVLTVLLTCTACGNNTKQFASPAYDPIQAKRYSQMNNTYSHLRKSYVSMASVSGNYAPVPYVTASRGVSYQYYTPARQVYYRGIERTRAKVAHNGQYFYRVR